MEFIPVSYSQMISVVGLIVVRKNSIRPSCSHLLQPVLVVQSTEHSLAAENVPCRKAMTMAARRWRWLDWVGNARTETGVNSRMIVMGDPVRQELFQMSLPKWDQEVQAFPSDRPDQPLTDGVGDRRLLHLKVTLRRDVSG